VTVMSKY